MKISLLKDQLVAIGESVDDEDLVSTTLDGFPPSWETFVSGVSACAHRSSFERLWTDCLQKEGRIMSKSGPPIEENQALDSNARKGKRLLIRTRTKYLIQIEKQGQGTCQKSNASTA